MIRLVAAVPDERKAADAVRWLSIEGDEVHGFLVRSFADLEQHQLFDAWYETLDDALDHGDAYEVSREAWTPRAASLPGGLPFPDLDWWVPENSAWETGGRQTDTGR
jgi:hypothetical protein